MFDRIAQTFGFTRKSLAQPDAELLALFSGSPTAAGISVGPASALSVPAVSCAVRAISEAVATLDVKVMKQDGAVEVETPDHPVALLLRDRVNDWTPAFEFLRDLTAQALIYDAGGLAWVNRVGGRIHELIHYEPGVLSAQRTNDGTGQFTYTHGVNALAASDVIHLRGPFGRSPVSLAREAIGLALILERHAAKLFKDTRPSSLVSFKERMSPEEMMNAVKAFMAMLESQKTKGTVFLDNEAKYSSMVLSSVDSQFMEVMAFQILQIARAFRVPPQMLFDLERATWSNSEQMGREFLTYTLEPWLRALEGALRHALFTEEEYPVYRIAFERDDLTRADLGQRATAYSSLIASRVLNPNEARSWEGLPPYDGGDEFANPHTSSTAPAGAAAPQQEAA